MFKKYFSLVLFCCTLLLVGCAGEPSSTEVHKAVEDLFSNDSSALNQKNLLGVIATSAGIKEIKLNSVDKIGCEPNGKNAYLCEVAVEYTITSSEGSISELLGVGGRKHSVNKYRLIKTSKSWIIDASNNQ